MHRMLAASFLAAALFAHGEKTSSPNVGQADGYVPLPFNLSREAMEAAVAQEIERGDQAFPLLSPGSPSAIFSGTPEAIVSPPDVLRVDSSGAPKARTASLLEKHAAGSGGAKPVKDMTDEIRKFKVEIGTAKSELAGTALTESTAIQGNMDKIGELEDVIKANAETSGSETTLVSDFSGSVAKKADNAVTLAYAMVKKQKEDEELTLSNTEALHAGTQNVPLVMAAEAANLHLVMKSAYDGALTSMITNSDRYHAKSQRAYEQSVAKFTAENNKLTDTQNRFRELETQLQEKTVAMIREIQPDVKEGDKRTTTMAKETRAQLKKGFGLINKWAKSGPTLFATKNDVEPAIKSAHAAMDTYLKEAYARLDKDVTGAMRTQAETAFGGISDKASKEHGISQSELSKEAQLDAAASEEFNSRSSAIGLQMLDAANNWKKVGGSVNTDNAAFALQVGEHLRDGLVRIAGANDAANGVAKMRLKDAAAKMDGKAAEISTKIKQQNGALMDATGEALQELDGNSQQALLGLGAGVVEIQNKAVGANGAVVNSQTKIAELDAHTRAGQMQAKLLVTKTHEAANQMGAQFLMRLGDLSTTDAILLSRYLRDAGSELDDLEKDMQIMVSKLPGEPEKKLEKAIQTIQAQYDLEKVAQKFALGNLDKDLATILTMLHKNPGRDDPLIHVELPAMFDRVQKWKDNENRKMTLFNELIQNEKKKVENNADNAAMMQQTAGNSNSAEMKRLIVTALNKINKQYTIAVSQSEVYGKSLGEEVMVKKGEVEQQKMYLQDTLGKIWELLATTQEYEKTTNKMASEQLTFLDTSKIPEISSMATQSRLLADQEIKTAMGAVEAKDMTSLETLETELMEVQKTQGDASKAKIVNVGDKLTQNALAQQDLLMGKIAALREEIQARTAVAQTEAARSKTNAQAIAAREAAVDGEVLRMEHDKDKAETRMKGDIANEEETSAEEMRSLLDQAKLKGGKLMEGALDDVNKGFDGLIKDGQMKGKHAEEEAVKDINMKMVAQTNAVSEAKRVTTDIAKGVDEDFKKRVGDVEGSTKKLAAEEKLQGQDAEEESEAETKAFDATEGQTNAVLTELTRQVSGAETESDTEADEMTDKLESNAQTIVQKLNMVKSVVDSETLHAEEDAVNQQKGIVAGDRATYLKARALQDHQHEYEQQAQQNVTNFQKFVGQLGQELDADSLYLANFEAYQRSHELQLIKKLIDVLGSTTQSVDTVYDELTDEENEFMTKAATLEGGEAFSTVKKIRDADVAIQKGIEEDQKFLQNLANHQKAAIISFPRILEKLEERYEEIKKEEKDGKTKGKQAEEDATARAAANLNSALDQMTRLGTVSSDTSNDEQAAAQTEDALKMMKVGQLDNEAQSNRTLNEMAEQEMEQERSGMADAENITKSLGADAAVSSTEGVEEANAIEDNVKKLLSLDEGKAAEAEEKNKNAIIDMMQKASAGTPESLLQTKARASSHRLASLLFANKQLTQLNDGLGRRHKLLGSQVEQVVALGRQLRESQPVEPTK